MSTKYKVLIAVVGLAVSFAVGRYTTPVKVKTEIKTVEVDHKKEDLNINQDKHKETVVTETVKPDGTKEIITKTVEDTKREAEKTSETENQINKDRTKEVTRSSGKITISVLGAGDIRRSGFYYGAHVSKEILGPISLGVFGLSSGVAGCSVGISF
jgi:hypothetical protein